MLMIATNCHLQFMAGRTTLHVRNGDVYLKHSPYFYDKRAAMDVLNDYLDKFYGLKASHKTKLFESGLDFVLKMEEVRSEDHLLSNEKFIEELSRTPMTP